MTQPMTDKKIAFIGCGNMATAILSGLIDSGWPAQQVMASNPSNGKLEALKSRYPLHTTNDNREAAEFADAIVLAVKPQKLDEVCQHLSTIDLSNKLIISVAAGFKVEEIAKGLNQSAAIVRSMPNTPSLIKQGATGLYAVAQVSETQKQLAESVFKAVGTVSWIEDEALMDVVTAIAGSSPAYVFLLMQAMTEQAEASGLAKEDAFALVTQAVKGAAELAQANPDKPLAQLRKEVTSPGGTTAAAINSFQNDDFEEITKRAIRASIKRGQELGEKA